MPTYGLGITSCWTLQLLLRVGCWHFEFQFAQELKYILFFILALSFIIRGGRCDSFFCPQPEEISTVREYAEISQGTL